MKVAIIKGKLRYEEYKNLLSCDGVTGFKSAETILENLLAKNGINVRFQISREKGE